MKINMAKRYLTVPSRSRPRGRTTGFTIIEVLVAVLVLAIGLLGIAGLQAAGLRNNQSAYQRTQATILAYDIVDRMRVNRTLAEDGPNPYQINFADSPAVPPVNCHAAACTPTQLAAFDLYAWTQQLNRKLPAGDGAIQRRIVGGTRMIFQVTVRWDDDRDGNMLNVQVESEL
jgi:type IV pilus assembly protein PilV